MRPDRQTTDAMLAEWGARLFFPAPKKAKPQGDPWPARRLGAPALSAHAVRQQVRALVHPGAQQVMVKITGGGRGMKAVAAHLRYISRLGKAEVGGRGESLALEDERGNTVRGGEAIRHLQDDWRYAGSFIADETRRREAFNIILSMPAGTPPEAVRDAARDFAQQTFEGHKYVFVLHQDTASPHVHLAVRAERFDGWRLNPRKADLAAWRARFAAALQDRGIHAVATRALVHGRAPRTQAVWRTHAARQGRERQPVRRSPRAERAMTARRGVLGSWEQVARALARSPEPEDRELVRQVLGFVGRAFGAGRSVQRPERRPQDRGLER